MLFDLPLIDATQVRASRVQIHKSWELTLSDESHSNDHSQSISRSTRVDQLAEIPPRVLITGEFVILDYFVVLQLRDRRVRVAVSVVLGQDLESLLATVVSDEPARRLWEEQNRTHNDRGHSCLHNGRDAPRPRRFEVIVRSVGRPSGEDVAQPPEVVVHSCHNSTVRRVRKLWIWSANRVLGVLRTAMSRYNFQGRLRRNCDKRRKVLTSTVYAGPAAEAMLAPKPRTKRPPMNCWRP